MLIGGLLGDVIFFAVSGFCLYNIKDNFINWYKKRIIRIYPEVWIITIIYLLIGFYTLEKMNIIQYFIYPTYYHFIASIIILYIFYYLIIKIEVLRQNIPKLMIGTFIIQLIIYIFFYNKTYYHIDVVREPMIRFLFFEAMLLGTYFRINKEKYMNKNNKINWVILLISMLTYFISKLIFSKIESISILQITNQYILIFTLYYILKCFAGIDYKLEKMPNKLKKIIEYIAKITLEIYLVQYPIIPLLADKMPFPINWIIITGLILILATLLHISVEIITKQINNIKGKRKNETITNRSI